MPNMRVYELEIKVSKLTTQNANLVKENTELKKRVKELEDVEQNNRI